MSKLLLYCTKAKPTLYKQFSRYDEEGKMQGVFYHCVKALGGFTLNGTIVAECDFEVEEHKETTIDWLGMSLREKIIFGNLCEKASIDELECYKYANGKPLYAIHLKNLHIFDEPKELSEYLHPMVFCNNYCENNFIKSFCRNVCSHNADPERLNVWCDRNDKFNTPITKAPQNMMNVCDSQGNHYVLISIKPEGLCKILNGEKDIEVRKVVLKEMLRVFLSEVQRG